MGTLHRYRPTLGMAQADRTEANYATKILEWLHSIEDLLTTVATITYTDKGCVLNPTFENISGKQVSIEVSGTNLAIGYSTGNQSPAWSTSSIALLNDPYICVVSDTDMISVGVGERSVITTITKGTYYDGTECGVLFGSTGTTFDWFITNAARYDYFSSGSGRDCQNKSSAYCVKQFTCYGAGIIANHVMYLDGGMGLPGTGQIFTLNDDTYIMYQQNFALKV
nr:MAG TPA: hypothetical protein [Caudoviricetes sp.]